MNKVDNEFIKTLDVKEGQTVTLDCPVCKGVKKFTATNQDGLILYNCYRNSCSVRGATMTPMLVSTIQNKIKGIEDTVKHEKFEMPEYITDGDNSYVQRFRSRWDLRIDLLYDVKTKRAVFPIYKNGRLIDAIGRALYDAQPKWLRYGGLAKYYSHVVKPCRKIAVVVEDVISATVIGENFLGTSGVALLGTNLMPEHKEYLDTFDKVIVALDPDAVDKTLAFTKELKSYCEPSEVLALNIEDDLKYKRQKDFAKLGELINGADRPF